MASLDGVHLVRLGRPLADLDAPLDVSEVARKHRLERQATRRLRALSRGWVNDTSGRPPSLDLSEPLLGDLLVAGLEADELPLPVVVVVPPVDRASSLLGVQALHGSSSFDATNASRADSSTRIDLPSRTKRIA